MHLFTEQFEMEAIEHIKKFSRIAQMEGLPVELGFSGGKDSIVCYSMCERSGIRVEKNFYYAFEDPDVVRFIREKYPDVTIRRKEKSYFQLIREKGFLPTSDIRYCCEYFKENTKNAQITGVRRQESAGRKKRKLFEMKGKKNARKYLDVFSENCRESGYAPLMLRPILHYRTEEIWDYIRRYGLPYPELYDQG
ncbi:MAG: phosphoadenosine phosphosulfate reductase family protein, partial [Prevotellaceae bacterium]|nr:phosphoadenosine phosphosulfate reductase family protein [Prevotellaceae bacterium]